MRNANAIKEELLQEIEKLPEDKLLEVLDFTEYLAKKGQKARAAEKNLDPARDPILKFIGGVTHGSLAKNIDTEIYGA